MKEPTALISASTGFLTIAVLNAHVSKRFRSRRRNPE